MKNRPLYKMRLNDVLIIEDLNLILKVTELEEVYEGKAYEELGDRIYLNISAKYKNEEKEFKYYWNQIVPENMRHLRLFEFELFIIKVFFDPYPKKDEPSNWVKFIIYPVPHEEIDYDQLLRRYLMQDKNEYWSCSFLNL